MLTVLPDRAAPPRSLLLGRAALSVATDGLDSGPVPECDEVEEDRAVSILPPPLVMSVMSMLSGIVGTRREVARGAGGGGEMVWGPLGGAYMFC